MGPWVSGNVIIRFAVLSISGFRFGHASLKSVD